MKCPTVVPGQSCRALDKILNLEASRRNLSIGSENIKKSFVDSWSSDLRQLNTNIFQLVPLDLWDAGEISLKTEQSGAQKETQITANNSAEERA